MRWKPHVRFGGRARETYQPRGWHRALVRPHVGNRCLDKVRRRVQNKTLGHRGRKVDPLYRIRKLLLAGNERLDDRVATDFCSACASAIPTTRCSVHGWPINRPSGVGQAEVRLGGAALSRRR